MKLRGRRRCSECDHTWSYYDTASIECPECGSIRSVGVDAERTEHTDQPVDLDLVSVRHKIEDRPLRDVAETTVSATREYLISRGFIHAGSLKPLDDTFLAAVVLKHVADEIRRSLRVTDDAERYFLALLATADTGERPRDVPSSLRSAYGRAMGEAAAAYRRDLSTWLNDHPDQTARASLATIRDIERRIAALDGDVPPADADKLIAALQDYHEYLTNETDDALARAEHRLNQLTQ